MKLQQCRDDIGIVVLRCRSIARAGHVRWFNENGLKKNNPASDIPEQQRWIDKINKDFIQNKGWRNGGDRWKQQVCASER